LNRRANVPDQWIRIQTQEDAMTRVAEIFAYDLTAVVFVVASVATMIAVAAIVRWGSREPLPTSDFSPTFGL
jgi:hypothetical protein